MRREGNTNTIPRRWLENARADLALARSPLPLGGLYEHLCFHAQQAAEKSLKAVQTRIMHKKNREDREQVKPWV